MKASTLVILVADETIGGTVLGTTRDDLGRVARVRLFGSRGAALESLAPGSILPDSDLWTAIRDRSER